MGYGELAFNRRPIRVHRFVYETFVGPIPPGRGWHIHHQCGNRLCINPDHLELLTGPEHKRRHRPTVCQRGHDLTIPENYYVRPDGDGGFCRLCARIRQQEAYSYELKRRLFQCQECGREYRGNPAAKYRFCSDRCRGRGAFRRRRVVA